MRVTQQPVVSIKLLKTNSRHAQHGLKLVTTRAEARAMLQQVVTIFAIIINLELRTFE